MAVPKKKTSHRRTRQRRAHDFLTETSFISCPTCKEPVTPHRACKNCGHYKGEKVLEVETKLDKKLKKESKQKEE